MTPGDGLGRPAEDGARAVALEGRTLTATRWTRSERAFTVAMAAIGLHLVDSRVGAARSFTWFLLDGLLTGAGVLLAVALFRHSGRARRGLLALLAGSAATIAGLGTTAARIWKMGPAGIDVTGLVSLLVGLTLLALGAATVIRAARGWRRLLALPVAALSLLYVFAPLTLAVYLTNVPRAMLGGRSPADEGLPYRDVTVTARDGTRLAGWYVPSRNGAAVVVLHGSGSSRLNILDHVGVLGRAGYGVMALDARGHGASDGEPMDVGWLAHVDIEAGVSFLARQRDVDPGRIGVVGISLGGTGALTAAAEDPRIAAVVAEGVAVTSTADAVTLPVDRWWIVPFYWMASTGADLLSPADPPPAMEDAAARMAPRPLLLISGRSADETFLNRRLREVSGPATELLALPDTKHSLGIWSHPERWTARVLGFLDRALGVEPYAASSAERAARAMPSASSPYFA
jgi:uncharacterized protein